jgi:hypothetical protein
MMSRLLSLFVLLVFTASMAGQNAEKTFSKSFNVEGKSKVQLDLPGVLDLKVWSQSAIRIEIRVNLPAGQGSVLNSLADVGRYNLTASGDGDLLTIKAPNLQKKVMLKGQPLREQLSFTVFLPKTVEVELPNSGSMVDAKQ